jgi:hypothetical protein
LDGVIGDGSYAALNQTVVQVADVNGTSTILINGTLPNGTTDAGSDGSTASGAASLLGDSRYALGWFTLIATFFILV